MSKLKQDVGRRVQTEATESDEFIDWLKHPQELSQQMNRITAKNKNSSLNKYSKSPFGTKIQMNYKPPQNRQANTHSVLIQATQAKPNYSQYTYSNLKVIGSGSFGVVYKSKVNETGEIVAIKRVLQDKRYKNREFQILQELDHPNVLSMKHAYFTQGENQDETYLHIVMDYYPETLYSYHKQFLRQEQYMPDILIKMYIYQLLRSIGYIYSKNICHRDIKPHNVLVNPSTNKLILCDFGSAKKLVTGEPNIAYICSRCYRAPELIFGATDYTAQIDVWSIGCILAELYLGKPIFLGDSTVDQLVEIIKILGTPTKEEVLDMNPAYDMKMFKFVQIKKRSWKKVFRDNIDPWAIDLIGKLLVYSPSIRLNSHQAMTHQFFDDLRDENYLKTLKISIPELYDFTKDELGKNAQLITKLIPKWVTKNIKIDLIK